MPLPQSKFSCVASSDSFCISVCNSSEPGPGTWPLAVLISSRTLLISTLTSSILCMRVMDCACIAVSWAMLIPPHPIMGLYPGMGTAGIWTPGSIPIGGSGFIWSWPVEVAEAEVGVKVAPDAGPVANGANGGSGVIGAVVDAVPVVVEADAEATGASCCGGGGGCCC